MWRQGKGRSRACVCEYVSRINAIDGARYMVWCAVDDTPMAGPWYAAIHTYDA